MSDAQVHRIWVDDGKHTEAEDGEDFVAHSARDAVEAWADQRYSALQHVDPGRLLVRTPRGVIESWEVFVRISFVTRYVHTIVSASERHGEDGGNGS